MQLLKSILFAAVILSPDIDLTSVAGQVDWYDNNNCKVCGGEYV